tara:strand:+ start:41 stop:604 length:564 start_codon:yes stop_codon:yes gene_type:complete
MHKDVFFKELQLAIFGGKKLKKIQDLCTILKGRINNMSETENPQLSTEQQLEGFESLANRLSNHYTQSETEKFIQDYTALYESYQKVSEDINRHEDWTAVDKLEAFEKFTSILLHGLDATRHRLNSLLNTLERLDKSDNQLDRLKDCLFDVLEDHLDSVMRDSAREDMREIAQEEIDDAVSNLYITR